MTEIAELSRRLLALSFVPDQAELVKLAQEAGQAEDVYLAADRRTTKESWESGNCAAYVSGRRLYLFLAEEDAGDFARLNGLLLDGKPMARHLSADEVRSLVAQYSDQGYITGIRLFVRMPLYLDLAPETVLGKQEKQAPTEPAEPATLEIDPEVIAKTKELLDTGDPSVRAVLDPGGCAKNFHTFLDRLLRDNKISMDTMDAAMGFNPGLTANLCTNVQDNDIPLRLLRQILDAFGLLPYIYQFRGQCREIASELAVSSIDIHQIKPASMHTTERFELTGIRRGSDANGAYVYQLALSSPQRQLTELVSTPLGYIVGKRYSVAGLDPVDQPDNATRTVRAPSDAELSAVTKDIAQRHNIRSYGDSDPQAEAEAHAQQRKNDIIRYMRQNLGYSAKDAEAKLASIYWEEDLLEEFWQYIKNNKPGKIKVRGYTARILMKELHFTPYEAYCQLVALRRNPKETEQMLTYRRTDPQYQKQ